MDDQAVIVWRGVSRYGLEQLHVIQSGPIEVEAWIEQVIGEAGEGEVRIEAWLIYEEEELGINHLRLYWRMKDEQ